MPGATDYFGWTTPDIADALQALVADIIQGLKDIENSFHLAADSHVAADTSDKYPLGISLMTLSGTGATNGAWPENVNSLVLTLRRTNGEAAAQFWVGTVSSGPRIRARTGLSTGWSPWATIAGLGVPTATASGKVTISGIAGIRSFVVLFPGNRFTVSPLVQLTDNTSAPDRQKSSWSNVTPSQVEIFVNRTDTSPATVVWTATQGADS